MLAFVLMCQLFTLSLLESMFSTPELNSPLKELTDVFDLDDLELGCTNIVHHAIVTGITSNHRIVQ